MKTKKVMAIIKRVTYENQHNQHEIFFTVYVNEHRASLQALSGERAIKFIEEYEISNIQELENKPVWVNDDGVLMNNLEPCIID